MDLGRLLEGDRGRGGDRSGRCRLLGVEVGLADFAPRDEAVDDLSNGGLQDDLNLPTVPGLLLGRDADRLEEVGRGPGLPRGRDVVRMDELGDRRRLELEVHMGGLRLLEAGKRADVAHKDAQQEIVDVVALGGCGDAVDLL